MFYNIQCLKKIFLKDVSSYIRSVNAFSILSDVEEKILAKRVYYHSDVFAARHLVISHLRFVVHITRTYSGYGLPRSDLIQEGNIGLMKSIFRFNPNINVRFISFAVYWIKSEIHEYILKNWRMIKIATTKSHRKLFFNLKKKKTHIGWFNEHEVKLVAKSLGVTNYDVKNMESRMLSQDISLFSISNVEKDGIQERNVKDYKSDFSMYFELYNWDKYSLDKLNNAILDLDPRSRYIVRCRWLYCKKKIKLEILAKNYGLSSERVRQIEQRAIKKLKLQYKL
ncbi:RNA polymerase sigma factor RpoH [Buchnera aphidicola (Pterocallis alni)]|uniref:RNA polymerase sigma factor RpoH n=1 Tax=Buchnera aphidicola TaxID=9 RepID=UPI003463D3B5